MSTSLYIWIVLVSFSGIIFINRVSGRVRLSGSVNIALIMLVGVYSVEKTFHPQSKYLISKEQEKMEKRKMMCQTIKTKWFLLNDQNQGLKNHSASVCTSQSYPFACRPTHKTTQTTVWRERFHHSTCVYVSS